MRYLMLKILWVAM